MFDSKNHDLELDECELKIPAYLMPRPTLDTGPEERREFDELIASHVEAGMGELIDYSSQAPKWQFLVYVAQRMEVVFHGTGDPAIAEFEPRQSDDTDEFGNQRAVYASSDPIWSLYFATMDRQQYVRSLLNSCLLVPDADVDGEVLPYYFFSVNEDALPHRPWRSGTIYILPRSTFEQQAPRQSRTMGVEIQSAQWRSFEPVRPLARLSVEPPDFPFLDLVRGHDVQRIRKLARDNPDGFPWLDE